MRCVGGEARQVTQTATTLRCGQDQSTSASQTPQGPHLLSRDLHRSRVSPSRPARRVISAIASFRPSVALSIASGEGHKSSSIKVDDV